MNEKEGTKDKDGQERSDGKSGTNETDGQEGTTAQEGEESEWRTVTRERSKTAKDNHSKIIFVHKENKEEDEDEDSSYVQVDSDDSVDTDRRSFSTEVSTEEKATMMQ